MRARWAADEERGNSELLRLEQVHELLALRGLPDGESCDERTCGVHSVHHCGAHGLSYLTLRRFDQKLQGSKQGIPVASPPYILLAGTLILAF
jgi:hypothetical protein